MLLYFSVSLFVSATLLFLVQPMIGKLILPRLGGTPAVWNTCMVFFQMMLLVGYGYTYAVTRWLRPRQQLVLHALVLVLPFAVLPFSLGNWQPPTDSNPIFSLFALLAVIVGLPFFVVSTSAPLLQRWFGWTGHPAAKDPYFLYGASNLGSMLALLAYPTIVEPFFGVSSSEDLSQVQMWTAGYGVFALLMGGAIFALWRATAAEPVRATEPRLESALVGAEAASTAVTSRPRVRRVASHVGSRDDDAGESEFDRAEAPTLLRRLRWVALAAVPSSLMLGLTTYMTTDIAAVPFFWVLPLALYLATFILVFARWPTVWTEGPHTVILYLQPPCILILTLILVSNRSYPTWLLFAVHTFTFLVTTLACHGELAKDRPPARYLTEFYLWMSVGGVLGGLFNALVAPFVFQTGIYEYAFALALAGLLRPNLVGTAPVIPGDSTSYRRTTLGIALDVLIWPFALAVSWAMLYVGDWHKFGLERAHTMLVTVIALLALAMRPWRFGVALGALFIMVFVVDRSYDELVYEGRGFFGLLRVRESEVKLTDADGGEETRVQRTLIHGGINHGRQIYLPAKYRRMPVTYFHPTNGVGEIFTKFSWPDERLPASLVGLGAAPWGQLVGLHSEPPYAVLGLGTGTLACHARPLQTMHFYEIDPLVRDLSLPPPEREPIFTFCKDALDRHADLKIIMGDGRLQLEKAPEKYYHIISLDAFSSDAIPVHLLTKEAVQLYLEKLADGGILIFNATNRYVRIQEVLAAIARDLDLDCQTCPDYTDDKIPDKYGADWLVIQRKAPPQGFGNGGPPLRIRLDQSRWENVEPLPGRVWTDDYSNLLRVMRW